jgi:formiminotetrahydrofolate cyclodeaminase
MPLTIERAARRLWHAGAISELAQTPLRELLERIASSEPVPGAGPSAAWTCALAAALVEMVCAVSLRKEPSAALEARRERAAVLRADSCALAERDMAVYGEVLAARRRRGEQGGGERLQQALAAAADPPLAIAEAAAEVTGLAAEAYADARGAVRGEALTAAVLAEAVGRACAALVPLTRGGAPSDPRRARAAALLSAAAAARERLAGGG